MMKRKRLSDDGESLSMYGAPPLESTMMIDTGGKASGQDCIGQLRQIPVTASLSSGSRLFQYNRFFWNNDLFTFNYNSCGIFLAISYFRGPAVVGGNGSNHFLFYPIFLPRSSMTMYQSLQSGATFDPKIKRHLVHDLLYYLNGAFTDYGADAYPSWYNGFQFMNPPQAVFKSSPTVYAYDGKGWLPSPCSNLSTWPILQSGAMEPPLKWVYVNSTGQIALIRNPIYWNQQAVQDRRDDIDFNIVSPLEYFTLSPGNPSNLFKSAFGPQPPPTQIGFTCPSVYLNDGNLNLKGWCGRGAFSIGFAQDVNPGVMESHTYTDDYIDRAGRIALFNLTRFDPVPALYATGFPNSKKFICMAKFICNLIPSRFMTIESDILTRDQKMIPISNNPDLARPSIMAIQFLSLDSLRTWKDDTLSGQQMSGAMTSGASATAGGGVNGINDTTVIHLNPSYSIQSIDFELRDEWQSIIQNYRSSGSNHNLTFSSNITFPAGIGGFEYDGNWIFGYLEDEFSFTSNQSPTSPIWPIPAWLLPYNPLLSLYPTTIPPASYQPLIAPFCSYNAQPAYMLNDQPPSTFSGLFNIILPSDFGPDMPISGNIIHFGRVLGY